MAKDPVCGMEVSKGSEAVAMEYLGKEYFFCAQSCKEKFENSPEDYIKPESKIESNQGVLKTAVPSGTRDGERLNLPVRGMSCASCVAKIEKGLAERRGVSDVKVNFAAERAAIVFDPGLASASDLV